MKTINGMKYIVLENAKLKLTILPSYGGKILSILKKTNNKEILFQNLNKLKQPHYGAVFSQYDSSGFDECFPSISGCIYPEGDKKGLTIPDHGEVWTMPWDIYSKNNQVFLEVYSPKFNYKLKKIISLNNNKITIDYKIINLSEESFAYLWTSHILFKCNEDTQLVIPHKNRIINLNNSSTHLEYLKEYSYPITIDKNNNYYDISKIEPITSNNCEKFYFLNPVKYSRLVDNKTKESITMTVPLDKVPYFGIWKTQGGYRGDYNIALEPCTGIYDSLEDAIKRNKVERVSANSEKTWWLSIEIN